MSPLDRWAQIRKAVTDAVMAAPLGISHHQLTVDLKSCGKAITRHLKALRDAGIVGYIGGCDCPVWVNAAAAPALAAAGFAARKEARRKRRTAQCARARARKRAGVPAQVKSESPRNVARKWAADIDRALLSLPDGASSEDIALRMGRNVHSVKTNLRVAHASGRCIQERIGMSVLWCHVDYSQRMTELRKAHDERRCSKKLTVRSAARRRARAAKSKAPRNDFDRPSVHIWSDASTARPLRVRGPNSVWGLAA